jgi:hypothetical protein
MLCVVSVVTTMVVGINIEMRDIKKIDYIISRTSCKW